MKAIKNVRTVLPDGSIGDNLTILFDQKILKIGKGIKIPKDTQIFDGKDCYLTPGLVDCHSHIGMASDGEGDEFTKCNEMTNPVTPELRVADAFNRRDRALFEALRGGVTTVGVFPGSGNVIGGQGATLKTFVKENVTSDVIIDKYMGLKMALGENPIRGHGSKAKAPMTRMAEVSLIREAFYKAKDYMDEKKRTNNKKFIKTDLGLEAIAKTFDGKKPVCIHAHRVQDIEAAVRLSTELGLRLILQHASESHRIVDLLAENNISCVVGPTLHFRSKLETREKTLQSLIALAEHEVPFSITMDHPVVPLWFLNITAGIAVREGLSESTAFKAITSSPAEFLGQGKRIGKVAEGFDADLVLWDGYPLQSMSATKLVFVNGEIAFDRSCAAKPDWEWYS